MNPKSIFGLSLPSLSPSKKRRATALVLGSGGARGWAHIGVLKALREIGFAPDICVGASIGAIAAAIQGSDAIDATLDLAAKFNIIQASKLFVEPSINKSGIVRGRRVVSFLQELIPAREISDLSCRYAAVATNLDDGAETVFSEGSLMDAIRASISIPGLFTPAKCGGGHFVDGGLVNPLPITVARAMGADFIIAVNINNKRPMTAPRVPATSGAKIAAKIFGAETNPAKMTVFEVFAHSLRIAEDRMTLDGIRAAPPDVLIEPAVGSIATLDFTRALEAIDMGYEATMQNAADLGR